MSIISDFNYSHFNQDTILITNLAGRHAFLRKEDFDAYCKGKPTEGSKQYLKDRLFFSDEDREIFVREYAQAVRSYRNYLFSGTGLHIFVLTSQCNLSCLYCQASTHTCGHMMTKEIAEKCVDLALQSPEKHLSFEFQGGEPLVNYDVLKHIVLYTEANNKEKSVEFNVVSNLTLLTEEMATFFKEHHINVSTSLDGPRKLHNKNRPTAFGGDSYEAWKENYLKLVERLGHGAGAIQTTTKYSLEYAEDIVDEYIDCGFDRVFIRPLTPLGHAATRWEKIGYTAEEFLVFYKKALLYILSKAKSGMKISEGHAVIFLNKILNLQAGNYTELRSPCGAGLGQLAYNYDGKIYSCDEGRMMAEMGDHSFQLGTVDSKYHELFDNPLCKTLATASCLESAPLCSDCVYAPYCGTCPVLNYFENKTIFPVKPNDYKCRIYKGMLDIIFEILLSADVEELKVLKEWCNSNCEN